MRSLEYKFSDEFVDRYRKFTESSVYSDIPQSSKSEYWKYHSDKVEFEIQNNIIRIINSDSGNYAPSTVGPVKKLIYIYYLC